MDIDRNVIKEIVREVIDIEDEIIQEQMARLEVPEKPTGLDVSPRPWFIELKVEDELR